MDAHPPGDTTLSTIAELSAHFLSKKGKPRPFMLLVQYTNFTVNGRTFM